MAYPWQPETGEVAVYVPWLTVSATEPGSQTYLNDFTTDTVPAATEAQQHITDAAIQVGAALAPLPLTPDGLRALAKLTATLLAAASLAVAYARTDDEVARAQSLSVRAQATYKNLLVVAENAGTDTTSPVPVAYTPDPVPWGDQLLQDQFNRNGNPIYSGPRLFID